MRTLAAEPPAPSLAHLALRFPPISLYLDRFRAVLGRRRRFVFDEEVDGLSRVEQAVAFLALLELGKTGEARLGQEAPFAPISVEAQAGRGTGTIVASNWISPQRDRGRSRRTGG